MPKLDITRTYADNESPVQADIDAIVDDVEIITNTTKYDDDNFQSASITASSKFVAASVTSSILRNSSVSSDKILDAAVITDKLAASSVTTAKLADDNVTEGVTNILSGLLPVGTVSYMHTFNGTVSIPRGWMLCNGDVIDETNYESQHGAGTYTTDSIATSAVLGKYLPNMTNKYAIGVDSTTSDGASAIASVGNSSNQIDLAHTHTHSHTHIISATLLGLFTNSASGAIARSVTAYPGTFTPITTNQQDPESDSQLSATQDISPESIEMLTILKVI